MFTGLTEEKGQVITNLSKACSNRLIISSMETSQPGESIAVNGVCLTVLFCLENKLHFDVSPETLSLTTLGTLAPKDFVNIERAMLASTRFGGHYVSGHVDTKAQILSLTPMGDCMEIEITGFSNSSLPYLIPKGSITVEGVSLTINAVRNHNILCMLVPHTLSHTTLGTLAPHQLVNIEFDYLARIVAHQLSLYSQQLDFRQDTSEQPTCKAAENSSTKSIFGKLHSEVQS